MGFGHDARVMVILSVMGAVGNALMGLYLVLYLESAGFPEYPGIWILVNSMAMAGTLVFTGALASRLGKKRILILGSVLSSLSVFIYLFDLSKLIIFAGAVLNGAAGGFFGPSFTALLSEKCGESRRKYLFSVQAFAGTISVAVVQIIGGFIPDFFESINLGQVLGFKIVFLIAGIIISVRVPLLFLLEDDRGECVAKGARTRSRAWGLMAKFALPTALIGLGAGFVVRVFQFYLRFKFDASYSVIGAVYATVGIVMALALIIVPRIADRKGSVRTIVMTQGIAIMLLMLIPAFDIFSVVIVLYLSRVILMNMGGPVSGSFMMSRIPEADRVTASSVNAISWMVLNGIGAYFGYQLMVQEHYVLPFIICTILYSTAVILYFFFFRDMDDKD